MSCTLFVSGWLSISLSESQTVKVQTGKEVTLMCGNFSSSPNQTYWFKLVNRSKPSCIAFMNDSIGPASFCGGFTNANFKMSSNISTVFLKIKRVDLSDSGLYFCGYYLRQHTVIASTTYLKVKGKNVLNYFCLWDV